MPLIKTIGSIKIYVYLRDHNPPHFHVLYAEYEELIAIKTLDTYSGQMPSKQRKQVIKWAEDNRAYLSAKWEEFNPDSKRNNNEDN